MGISQEAVAATMVVNAADDINPSLRLEIKALRKDTNDWWMKANVVDNWILLVLLTNFGGAGRDRTDDLYNAIVALSQLSYGPKA